MNARYHLALIYQQQKDDASALRLLQEVVRDKPDYGAAYYVMGYLYAKSPATAAQARANYKVAPFIGVSFDVDLFKWIRSGIGEFR